MLQDEFTAVIAGNPAYPHRLEGSTPAAERVRVELLVDDLLSSTLPPRTFPLVHDKGSLLGQHRRTVSSAHTTLAGVLY